MQPRLACRGNPEFGWDMGAIEQPLVEAKAKRDQGLLGSASLCFGSALGDGEYLNAIPMLFQPRDQWAVGRLEYLRLQMLFESRRKLSGCETNIPDFAVALEANAVNRVDHAAIPKKSFAVTLKLVASAMRIIIFSLGTRPSSAYRRTVSLPVTRIVLANSA